MPRADLTLVLFWASLGISAAAFFLFLWLMREPPHRDVEANRTTPRREP